jgi:hypothetical protein
MPSLVNSASIQEKLNYQKIKPRLRHYSSVIKQRPNASPLKTFDPNSSGHAKDGEGALDNSHGDQLTHIDRGRALTYTGGRTRTEMR